MTTLWDTTGTEVVKALAAERRTGGAMTSGCALTLVVAVDEHHVSEAEAAATMAAQQHPLRLLIVVRRQVDAPIPRLDAEVLIGGRLGPGEAVVMRMYGRLSLHSESVVLPLLAPDVPVVTWWHGPPPDVIAHDPLGVLADRRITECIRSRDCVASLRQRAIDYAPGDTDLSWTRITPWRIQLAAALDTTSSRAVNGHVEGLASDGSALLLAGWLQARLGIPIPTKTGTGERINSVQVALDDNTTLRARRTESRHVILERQDAPPSTVALPERELGDLLAEELRNLDADQPYADALQAATGIRNLSERSPHREHIWRDPALVQSSGPTK